MAADCSGPKTPHRRWRLPAEFTSGFMSKLDQRCAMARELKRRMDAVEADLGGAPALTYAQRSLIKRAVFLEAKLEGMEAETARGKSVDSTEYLGMINALRQLWLALGLRRQARELSLSDYLGQQGDSDED
jgi:hypothetical protein